jgi:DNA-binding transcriptional MerR regulator
MAEPDRAASNARELTYPLRAAARLTGLSPEVLRAWERRYGAVEPLRTPGGTRRYRASDLERLRLLKAAVDAGHRIGQLVDLPDEALRERIGATRASEAEHGKLGGILDALQRLDAAEARRLLSLQISALGPVGFARDVAAPLLREIGERWSRDEARVSVEHLATALIREQLGSALRPTAFSLRGPAVVFTTPEGERHEMGLQMAAVAALDAGANALYLGLELPVEECVEAVRQSGASALALSVVTLERARAEAAIGELRDALPPEIRVWVGGHGASALTLPEGVEYIVDLERLQSEVALLGLEARP